MKKILSLFSGTQWVIVVFLLFFALSTRTVYQSTPDNTWTVPVALSLVNEFNLDIDEYLESSRLRHNTIEQIAKTFNYFPYGTSLLISPLIFLLDITGYDVIQNSDLLNKIIAAIFVALACSIVFVMYSKQKKSLGFLMLALFYFASSVSSTASTNLWQHTVLLPIYSYVIYVLYNGYYQKGFMLYSSFGLLYFSFLIRPISAIPIFFLSLFLWKDNKKAFLKTVPIGLIIILLSTWYSLSVFGEVFIPYANPFRLGSSYFWEALIANLISPARGLLIYSPIFLIALMGFFESRRRNPRLSTTFLFIIVFHWVIISSYHHWWGGASYGPRFFTDVVPFLLFFLYFGLVLILKQKGWKRSALIFITFMLCSWSVYAHLKGSFVIDTYYWNLTPEFIDENPLRIWDYKDPAFFRGVW